MWQYSELAEKAYHKQVACIETFISKIEGSKNFYKSYILNCYPELLDENIDKSENIINSFIEYYRQSIDKKAKDYILECFELYPDVVESYQSCEAIFIYSDLDAYFKKALHDFIQIKNDDCLKSYSDILRRMYSQTFRLVKGNKIILKFSTSTILERNFIIIFFKAYIFMAAFESFDRKNMNMFLNYYNNEVTKYIVKKS